nr:ARID DNA-binding domain-containing protein [Tanacetum cinerariifolium]
MEALGERGVAVDSLDSLKQTHARETAKLVALTYAIAESLAGIHEKERHAKCMVLVSIVLQTDIGTRVLGMKEEDKVVLCILLETETLNRATGIMGFSLFPLLKILHKLNHHLLPFLMPKSLMQSRSKAYSCESSSDMDERVHKGVSADNRAANASRVAVVKAVQNRMHDLIDDRPIQIEGHIIKFCPIKIKDEAEYAQSLSDETVSKFTLDKSMILCFKCKGYGHFANKCPSKKQEQPKVSIKYPEFIHFKTRSVLKGTDQGTWDDLWANKKGEMARAKDNINSSEVHTFYEFVTFLNLIKNDEIVSKGWDTYREIFDKVLKWFYNHYLKRQLPGPIPPIIHGVQIYLFDLYKLVDCMGGYLSVNFGQEFDVIAKILRLTKGDGKEIKRCYISYLDVFTSYYKTARAPQIPTKVEEDSESLLSYQWNTDRTCAPKTIRKERRN